MKNNYENVKPIFRAAVLAAAATIRAACIDCRNLSYLVFTGLVKFHASATGNVTVNLYYSPDGKNIDTLTFQSLTLTCSAGNAVQISELVSVPDTGFIIVDIVNADSTYAQADVALFSAQIYQFIEDRQTKAGF